MEIHQTLFSAVTKQKWKKAVWGETRWVVVYRKLEKITCSTDQGYSRFNNDVTMILL